MIIMHHILEKRELEIRMKNETHQLDSRAEIKTLEDQFTESRITTYE
ncbi:uncharacterized protein G2W53_041159 [Senna tora]|uniref:Uncharacterized protein n=1 Tax=Senna tora TaxID=362788 RepID=A0A834SGY5_9FABA|nr:uncharacterized protein G2W53_041159 [Senna tora]